MRFLYSVLIHLYGGLISLVSPFKSKALQWKQDRKNYKELWTQTVQSQTKPIIWFHCASVGECEQILPLIQRLQNDFPGYACFLSFFSPSGYAMYKNHASVDAVLPLPLDTPSNARWLSNLFKPHLVVFVKYEFWFNLLSELHQKNIPVVLACAIFRPHQIFFKFYGAWFRNFLKLYHCIFIQDKYSEQLLSTIVQPLSNTLITGDSRLERVLQVQSEPFNNHFIDLFIGDANTVIIAGSTWPLDHRMLVKAFFKWKQLKPHSKLILVPHEWNSALLSSLVQYAQLQNLNAITFSSFQMEHRNEYDVLILDVLGMLSKLYRKANLAYVGGGFNSGLHNTLEPAVYNCPITFSDKRFKKYQEAEGLVLNQFALCVHSEEALVEAWKQQLAWTQDSEWKKRYRKWISEQSGAVDRMMGYFKSVL